jgi:hypothetical protein
MNADGLAWVQKCALQLKKLNPEMDDADAHSIAESAFVHTTGLTPEEAAQFFAANWATSGAHSYEP